MPRPDEERLRLRGRIAEELERPASEGGPYSRHPKMPA
jgi:hypothetical protein